MKVPSPTPWKGSASSIPNTVEMSVEGRVFSSAFFEDWARRALKASTLLQDQIRLAESTAVTGIAHTINYVNFLEARVKLLEQELKELKNG